ncbi:restriction endonuclease subunit S [Edwardsiella ictaluri]|uniref:Restriction endonuclease subunit S n=1 Tax=Edwardsiella ictaluri TaxID=67780 RepID=A0ABY8GCY3_EDWIC|nr:restriction endonuclease subunit S [Edwardsiella ictaluri]WFN95211.1 restriction endonuclease subunit S [Edwardsiella ictaluri]
MAKYKAYPEYKDSGVEWLGEVPLNWHIHSLKRAVDSCTNGVWGGEPDDKHDLIVLRVADFDRQSFKISDLKLTTRSILPKDRGSRLLKKGDLLIEKSGGGDKTLVGCVVLFDKDYEAVTSNFVAKMSPRESYDGHFLTYAFSQLYAGKVNYPSIKQTTGIQNLDVDAYLMEKFCFPPMHEQRNISCFLDHETAKIDNLIEKQQQLIELLKEKRQAVISHAVTKGLNPDVPMKDSGVEWVGEVPEHWEVSSLGYYSSLNTGATPDRSNSKYWNGEIAWIKTGEINYNNICFSEEKITYEAVKNTSVRLSPPGTLLMAMYGQGITRGRVAILDISAAYNQACVAISPNETLLNVYLRLFFMAGYHAIRDGGNETSQMNLNADIVRKFKILVPPLSEQKEIVSYLDYHLPQIEMLVERADSVIALLQERRTTLISAAVTGKIDVRAWVAPDMQDTEEPQEVSA